MRWFKLIFAILTATFRKKLTVFEESNINFRVWPTDVDANIMNHAPMMTIMEMGFSKSSSAILARQLSPYVSLICTKVL